MNQQEIEKTEDFQETEESETVALNELTVNDEQAEQVKGGPLSGVQFNHNETTAEDEDEEDKAESLDDLAVEDDEQVKGGPLGGMMLNHNETINSDDEAKTMGLANLVLADLQPPDDFAEAVAAGTASSDVIVTREDKDRRGKTIDKSSPILYLNQN